MCRIATVATSLVALALPAVTKGEEGHPQPEQATQATVIGVEVKRPPRRVYQRARLKTPSKPTPSYVIGVIVPHEAGLWGASFSTLRRRIMCESHGRWWATNGQYAGIGQFAPGTFYRGMSTIATRSIVIRTQRYRRMHSRVYRHWSDGRTTRNKGRVVRQFVTMTRRGRIRGTYPDAWSEARIMAQANAGRSAVHDNEWQCR